VRFIVPLAWIVILLFSAGAVQSVRDGLVVLEGYYPRRCTISQVVVGEASVGSFCRVSGWAYWDMGYEHFREEGVFGTVNFSETLETYYLLVDHDTSSGVFVRQLRSLVEGQEPTPTVIVGRLEAMKPDLWAMVSADDWEDLQINLARPVLRKYDPHLPLFESILLLLCLLAIVFLVMSPRVDFLLFRPDSVEDSPYEGELVKEVELRLTARLAIAGTRRRVHLVKARAKLQRTEEEFEFVVDHRRRKELLVVSIPVDAIEQLLTGRVYAGGPPLPGIWMRYRDSAGKLQRLCLSFPFSGWREIALAILRGQEPARESRYPMWSFREPPPGPS
jgi:hypothetical protein